MFYSFRDRDLSIVSDRLQESSNRTLACKDGSKMIIQGPGHLTLPTMLRIANDATVTLKTETTGDIKPQFGIKGNKPDWPYSKSTIEIYIDFG